MCRVGYAILALDYATSLNRFVLGLLPDKSLLDIWLACMVCHLTCLLIILMAECTIFIYS